MKFATHFFFILLIVFQFSCTDDKMKPLFKVITSSVELDTINTTNNNLSVIVYGEADQECSLVLTSGTCCSEKPNPTIVDIISDTTYEMNGVFYHFKTSFSSLKPNTTYYFRNFVETNKGLQYGNCISMKTTNSVLFEKPNRAFLYGINYITTKIRSNGGSPILNSGVVWSKSKKPTIDLPTRINQLPDSTGTIKVGVDNFEPATNYYVRSYAVTSFGVSYSDELMFTSINITNSTPVTDIDGNEYKTIRIGNQIWMCENLRTTRYRNGDLIGTTTPANKNISGEYLPKYQWVYNGDESNAVKFGRLYTWYVVSDSRGIAPEGWRVPSFDDFNELEKFLVNNGYNYPEHSGSYMDFLGKSLASKTMWEINAIPGNVGCEPAKNNVTNFNAYPVGYKTENGSFIYLGWTTVFWSSNAHDYNRGLGRQLTADDPDLWNCYSPKSFGCAVRCVKNAQNYIQSTAPVKQSNSQQAIIHNKFRTR